MRCGCNVRPLGQSQCQAQRDCGLRIADCGLRIDAVFNSISRPRQTSSALRTPHSALWPPACVRVKTDATRRRYGYSETEEYGQEEHQEGAGGVARHVVERTL